MHSLARLTSWSAALPLVLACRSPAPAAAPAPAHDMSAMAAMTTPDTARVRTGYTAADVRFMQGMIAHHGQALTMTALVPARAKSDAVKLLAEKIDVSQKTEIATMQRWLRDRGERVPAPDDMSAMHHAMGHDMSAMPGMAAMSADTSTLGLMPGMLTAAQLAQLAAATGADFDRLFLDDMIRHHEGAITMVATLFGTTGSGQEPQLFDFANGVDADQRAEIDRMRALLATR